MGVVWNMIRQYPVLKMGEETALSDEEKHSSSNLTEEGKRGRALTRVAYPGILERRETTNSTADEMKRAILRAGLRW